MGPRLARLRRFGSRLTHLLLLLALVTGAFGTAPLLAGKTQGVDLSDYALPDGSLPLLCLPGTGSGDEDGTAPSGHCPYCCTAAQATLPPLPATPQSRLRPEVHSLPGGTSLPAHRVFRPAAPLRGPPAAGS